jgi:hypothetical protein
MSQLERELQMSIDFVLMRKTVTELARALAEAMHENDVLREELKLAELKLQRMVKPRIVACH